MQLSEKNPKKHGAKSPKALKLLMAHPATTFQVGASEAPHCYLKKQSRNFSSVKNYLKKKKKRGKIKRRKEKGKRKGVAHIFRLPWFLETVVFTAFQILNIDIANFTWRSGGIFSSF